MRLKRIASLFEPLLLKLTEVWLRWQAQRVQKRRSVLMFCPTPLINNKYWAAALREGGHDAETFVTHYYANYRREDFDRYYDDVIAEGRWQSSVMKWSPHFRDYVAFLYVLENARVVHIPFTGGPLGATPLWRLEAPFYKAMGIKVAAIPYGGDAHMYSTNTNTSMRNALLIDYPAAGRLEPEIRERVDYWTKHADFMMCGALVYGMSRWDLATPSPLAIDVANMPSKSSYSRADGREAAVRIAHAPNHRGFKGTEFIIAAVEALKSEGLLIELVLMENIPNTEVLARLLDCDILVEQLIAGSYALNAIEGMACGIAVMGNCEDDPRRQVFRRYSFAEECPILSVTPESILENLRLVVTRPDLRECLGRAARAYAEKYHSYHTARFLFESVYDRIVHGKSVDLMNLFHPLKSSYNHRLPRIDHPLIGGHLPELPPSRVSAPVGA